MKITLIAVGKLKDAAIKSLCDEYIKRMQCPVAIREIESPKGATAKQEAALILKHLPDSGVIVALDERGETLSSPAFAEKISRWQEIAPSNEITFLIGGADGFDESVREKANFLLSFGKQTWPHMLVRVMLLEQVYRARQIIAGHPYHRV